MDYHHILSLVIIGALFSAVLLIERVRIEATLAAATCLFAGFTGYSAIPFGFGIQISFLLSFLLLIHQAHRRSALTLPSKWITVWFLVAVASSAMSYCIPGEVDGMKPWLKSLKQVLVHCSYMVCCMTIYHYLRNATRIERIIRYLFAGGVVAALIALAQPMLVNQGAYELADLFWNNPSYGGVVAKQQGIMLQHVAKSSLDVIRVWGPAMEPNYLGSFLCFTLLAMLGMLLRRRQDMRWRVLSRCGYVVCLGALILSQSRGAILGYGIGLLGFLFSRLQPARLLKRCAAGVVVVAASAAILFAFADAVAIDPMQMMEERFGFLANEDSLVSDYSAGARLAAFRIAIDMTADHPLLGVGIGNYGFHVYDYLRYEHQYKEFRSGEWHVPFGWPAASLAETGVLGTICFLGILVSTMAAGFRLMRNPLSRDWSGVLWGFIALTAEGVAGSQVITPVWWIAIALIWAARRTALGGHTQLYYSYDLQITPSTQRCHC